MSAEAVARLTAIWETPPTVLGALATVDHKKIGGRYIATAFAFLIVGGVEALLMRVQLAGPNRAALNPATYNQMFSMHGMTMI